MAYDASKDKVLAHVYEEILDDGTKFEVTVRSFDGGPKKVCLHRTTPGKSNGGYVSQLCRLDATEVSFLFGNRQEIMKYLDANAEKNTAEVKP